MELITQLHLMTKFCWAEPAQQDMPSAIATSPPIMVLTEQFILK
jgi:hypothetical protein